MKKIFIGIFLVFGLFATLGFNKAYAAEDRMLYIHYYRFDDNYSNWDVWAWEQGKSDGAHEFVVDDTDVLYNFGGVVSTINLTETHPDANEIGILIRRGGDAWSEKDPDMDRYVDVSDRNKSDYHFYFVQGDFAIGTSLNDPNGPSKSPKFTKTTFVDDRLISFESTANILENTLKVFENDVEIAVSKITKDNDKKGIVHLVNDLDYTKTYKISVTVINFEGVEEDIEKEIDFIGMYDNVSFHNEFYYEGELGAIHSMASTTFKIWAPLASEMVLNLYDNGTPANYAGGDNTKTTHAMTKGAKGVYSVTVPGDLHGKYYTVSVTNGQITSEVVDPYAKGVGLNGLRGLVVDFSRTNPTNWDEFDSTSITTPKTDSIIYELHVRDLTIHESWNGTEVNRGMYLGLIEEGTKYEGLTTGFDHVKDLGITHLQLLPIFDYGNAIDESKQHDEEYNSFNWGYMPLNFNALEGNYSSNPHDGLLRINEFKQVVMAYGNEGIKINMDVVYNHTGQSADSNFNLLVPGYYHRFNSNGGYSNGSGTGNETASERSMVRKFIVDSVVFWAEEYKLGGFRFDLMALHDVDTMNELSAKLHDFDENILIYGEPWMGGDSPLDSALQSGKDNLHELDNIGAFNDDTRDGIKGSVFSSWMPGFIQGDYSQLNKVKYGILGGITHSEIPGYNVWHTSPDKILNYVTAHDNNTLHDKLYQSLEPDSRLHLIEQMSLSSHGIILTSQGISFIHAGDEFLRSKEITPGKFDSNSYQSPDEINQIRWDLKVTNKNHYDKFKELLDIRNDNKAFRLGEASLIRDNVKFIYKETKGVISYAIEHEGETFVVVVNATDGGFKFTEILNEDSMMYSSNNHDTNISGNSFYIFKLNETGVAFDSKLVSEAGEGMSPILIVGITLASIGLASALGVGSFVIIKKRRLS